MSKSLKFCYIVFFIKNRCFFIWITFLYDKNSLLYKNLKLARNEHSNKISAPHLEGLACARAEYFTYMCSRNVLKCSDFIFYVAAIKNNKFNANLRFCQKYCSISGIYRRARAGCAPKILWKIFAKIILLKVCKFSFPQKHTFKSLKNPINYCPKLLPT